MGGSAQVIEAPLTREQRIQARKPGVSLWSILGRSEAPTTFILEFSLDGSHFFQYETWAGVVEVKVNLGVTFEYARLTSKPAGRVGDKVSLYLAGS